MITYDVNVTIPEQLRQNYKNHKYSIYKANSNGLVNGFQEWECYMLIKYGKQGQYGVAGDYEYLIELPMYPENVQESISPNWTSQNVLGRSSPLAAYANTSLKSVNFTLTLHRDFLTGSYSLTKSDMQKITNEANRQPAGKQLQQAGGPFDTRTWYVDINKMLQMSCYPQYTTVGLIPPTTYFIFGQMILKGYVSNYSTNWTLPIINSFYAWNTVTIAMECYPDTIMSARDLIYGSNKNNQGTASTQNTYNTKFPTQATVKSNVLGRSDTDLKTNLRDGNSLGGAIRTT